MHITLFTDIFFVSTKFKHKMRISPHIHKHFSAIRMQSNPCRAPNNPIHPNLHAPYTSKLRGTIAASSTQNTFNIRHNPCNSPLNLSSKIIKKKCNYGIVLNANRTILTFNDHKRGTIPSSQAIMRRLSDPQIDAYGLRKRQTIESRRKIGWLFSCMAVSYQIV